MHPQKGVDDLLATLVWLKQRLPDFRALIIGKTVTAELATFAPNETRNPLNIGAAARANRRSRVPKRFASLVLSYLA